MKNKKNSLDKIEIEFKSDCELDNKFLEIINDLSIYNFTEEQIIKTKALIYDVLDFEKNMPASNPENDEIILKLEFLLETIQELKTNIKELSVEQKSSLTRASKMIKECLNNIKYNREEVLSKYDFVWFVISKIRKIDLYKNLIKKNKEYFNVIDANGNSLLFNVCSEYLKTFDQYYLSVIALILNNRYIESINLNEEIKKIRDSIIERENKVKDCIEIKRLKLLLKKLFAEKDQEYNSRNITKVLSSPNIIPDKKYDKKLDVFDYYDRVDLTSLFTISLLNGNCSCLQNSNTAYSILNRGNTIEFYYHIIDLAEFIKEDSPEDLSALIQNRYLKYNGNPHNLFDKNYLNDYVLFTKNSPKLAVSIKITMDKDFNVKKVEPMESAIKIDKFFDVKSLNESYLNEKDEEIVNLIEFANYLRAKRNSNEISDFYHTLQSEFTIFANLTISKLFNDKKKPFIYKNYVNVDLEKEVFSYSEFSEYINKYFDRRTIKYLERVYEELPQSCVIYSTDYLNHEYFKRPYGLVTNPDKRFTALENLRLIKKFLIQNKITTDEYYYWKTRIEIDTIFANLTSASEINKDICLQKHLPKNK